MPNVIFNWMNIFVQMGGNLTTRIVWSISIEVVIFILTIALAMSDSSSWPGVFFWITMVSVVILNSTFRSDIYWRFLILVFIFLWFQWQMVFTRIQFSAWRRNCQSSTPAPWCSVQTWAVHSPPSFASSPTRSRPMCECPPFITLSQRSSCCSSALTPILRCRWT